MTQQKDNALVVIAEMKRHVKMLLYLCLVKKQHLVMNQVVAATKVDVANVKAAVMADVKAAMNLVSAVVIVVILAHVKDVMLDNVVQNKDNPVVLLMLVALDKVHVALVILVLVVKVVELMMLLNVQLVTNNALLRMVHVMHRMLTAVYLIQVTVIQQIRMVTAIHIMMKVTALLRTAKETVTLLMIKVTNVATMKQNRNV